MKTLMTICFAGAMFIATGRAAQNDAGAEERFHEKFGRNTPMEEARQQAHKSPGVNSPTPATSLAPRNDSGAEERFREKFGRNTPAEEARQRAATTTNLAAPLSTSDAGFEQRFREKFGRSSPRV
jgi:hypothetical protein